jgi:soluble cytochrome b562
MGIHKIVAAVFIIGGIICFFHCSTLPKDSLFMVQKLDNSEKSRAITDKGIRLYKSELENKEKYEMIEEIKEYFTVALRLDPENQRAEEYVKNIESYISRKVREKIDKANNFLKKKKRTEKEDFQLVLYVQQAYTLEPRNKDVQKLLKEINELSNKLIIKYIEMAQLTRKEIGDNDTIEEKVRVYSECIESINKALLIDAQHPAAKREKKYFMDELSGFFNQQMNDAEKHYKSGDFQGADKKIPLLIEINKALDDRYRKELNDLIYKINLKWASVLFDEKKYSLAEVKIKKAVRIKRTKESEKLKDNIMKKKEKSDFSEGFDDLLSDIDDLIKSKDLINAHKKITYGLENAANSTQTGKLKKREQAFKRELAKLYEEAINYYIEEDFKEAMRLFKVIIAIDKDYKQAQSYYNKAQSKQKLLESY